MKISTKIMMCAFLVTSLCAAAGADVVVQPDAPMLSFAGNDISQALKVRKEDARVIVGLYDWLPEKAAATQPPDVKEAFAITLTPDGRIIVVGRDEAGAMYGALEVAEQIRIAGVQSVTSKRAKPFLALRQYKYNLPELKEGHEYFHTEEYWRGFFDLLARARFNSIGFWQSHPFPFMISYERFPEAAVLTPEQTQRNIKTYSMIFRLAKERNISTYLINWNIHLSPNFAKAHNIPPDGFDSPLVRDYMRYCVAQTLRTYPDLTGLGVCAGERMPSEDYDWREQWVKDTFVAGIRDSGRVVPLIHRYWWAAPDSIQRIICAEYPGEVIVEIKYNGEHMYSGLRPHFLDKEWIDFPDYKKFLARDPKKSIPEAVDHLQWITLPGRTYKIMWHLRNDCMFLFRWGDPEFVRQVIRNSHPGFSLGYLMGEETMRPGLDTTHTEKAQAHQTWKYEWERHWFRFMLWGRLGYDPEIPDSHWQAVFRHRFGADGDDLFNAYAQSSVVIPTITRFHFNYMNGDWQPEWCRGLWNTGFGRGRNYRDRREFHNVLEFIFNHTIEDGILDIPEYVGLLIRGEKIPEGALTPLQIAEQLEAASKRAAAAVERVLARGQPKGEAACYCEEFPATAELGLYYAEKIRGATALMHYLATGEKQRQDAAVERLKSARAHWERFISRCAPHYRGTVSAERSLRDVERDIIIAQHAQPAPDALAKFGVLQRAVQRPRFDFSTLSDLVHNTIASNIPPTRRIDQVDISPATCDAMILGREAWDFNALPPEQKRAVLEAVEKGVSLVLFFQNFPKFDPSWLPGNIAGSENDADSWKWTAEHPITKGVDPGALTGKAVVNDPLSGGDAHWQSITDPPGGLMLRQHGKGWIIFCQLDVLYRYKEPAARRLIENIITFATGSRKKPRIVLLDEHSGVDRILAHLKVSFLWYDELPWKSGEK